jgi:hypothetical protein
LQRSRGNSDGSQKDGAQRDGIQETAHNIIPPPDTKQSWGQAAPSFAL